MTNKILNLKDVHHWLPPRSVDAHKGLFGHILAIGGDKGMPGSIRLAAEGALRTGAGRVTVATHNNHILNIISARPELMGCDIDNPTEIENLIKKVTFIILGPGLGQSAWSKSVIDIIFNHAAQVPMLIDADGLNWLANSPRTSPHWILTPHPGEAARLLNTTVDKVQFDRKKAIQSLQEKYGGIIVLKGAQTLIAKEKEPIQLCQAGNPGMASPGMGDLLCGVIGGLFVQGLSLWQAAQAGVLIHAKAGDRIASRLGQRGLLASDLLMELPLLVNELSSPN